MIRSYRAGRPAFLFLIAAGVFFLTNAPSFGYPLDGFEKMSIGRLDAYAKIQAGGKGTLLPPGALLPSSAIRLHLAETSPDWELTEAAKDPVLQSAIESLFRGRDPSYAITVIDITDPDNIAWAGLREDRAQLPGSVGKILCMTALFDGLARAFPDTLDRARVLRETVIEATDWVMWDSHKVPHYDAASRVNRFATITPGNRFNLAEWIDHMISSSANSAGATVWKEAILLHHFGASYPPSRSEEVDFFAQTPKSELQELQLAVIREPLARAGIDISQVQQGTMWTKGGQQKIPGVQSFATPRELARILLRIEQGRLVDCWSSLEMKKFLYMTKKRYRYVFAPELHESAVYFKSGSFYKCREEEGFACAKYKGNVTNIMNSIAIIESPAAPGPDQKVYLVALTSNVLRLNSAWDHSRIGAAIDQAIRTRKGVTIDYSGGNREQEEAGRGD